MNWNDCPGILRNPEICGGEYIFTGSRVPVRALFENLRDGASVQEFSQWFPSVSLEAAGQVLKFLEASLSKKERFALFSFL